MSVPPTWPQVLDFFGTLIVIEPSQRETEGLLAEAVAAYGRERQVARQQGPPRPPVPSRLFTGFWYQAGTWPCDRYVVAKAEANDRGTNRRFVVTNRPGAQVLPEPTYDEYAARGESENRNADSLLVRGLNNPG